MAALDYMHILARRWWLAPLPFLLILAATFATSGAAPPPSYAVVMRFSAGLPPEPPSRDVYNYDRHYNWLASEYITRGLAQAVETGEFAKNVSQRLAPQAIVVPAGAIRSEYVASYMKVTVSWPDAAQAAAIASATVDELRQNGAAYWPQLQGVTDAPVRLLDDIVAVPVVAPLRSRFDLPVRALLGLVAGVLLVFGLHFFDPVVRDRRDLERGGLRVFGELR